MNQKQRYRRYTETEDKYIAQTVKASRSCLNLQDTFFKIADELDRPPQSVQLRWYRVVKNKYPCFNLQSDEEQTPNVKNKSHIYLEEIHGKRAKKIQMRFVPQEDAQQAIKQPKAEPKETVTKEEEKFYTKEEEDELIGAILHLVNKLDEKEKNTLTIKMIYAL